MSFITTNPLDFSISKPTYSSPITCNSLSAGISFTSPAYSSSFISPPGITPSAYTPPSPDPATNNTISSLRTENSQLVSQSQRLLSELESTSGQLSVAKRKIYSLENKLPKDKENWSGLSQKPINSVLESTESSSPSNQRDDEWNVKQRMLQDQLTDVQEECRRLRDACADVEQRTRRRTGGTQQYERPISSQSWRGFPISVPNSFQAPPTSRYSSIKDTIPPNSSNYPFSSNSSIKPTASNSSSGSSYKPLDSGLDRSLSGSNTSLSSIKSAREPLTSSINHTAIKSSYSSSLNSNHGSLLELEKAKIKVRKLEKQVGLLEQQLKEKTKTSEHHVEELTKLRTLMAQEKAANAINTHQAQEKAASELGRIKALNMEQSNGLQAQIGKLKEAKAKLEDKLDKICVELKDSHNKNQMLSENVSKLSVQIEGERASHRASLDRLRQEAGSGQKKVSELERELKNCQAQLTKGLKAIEMEKETKETEAIHLSQQVKMLSDQLQSCREQLSEASQTIHQMKAEIDERERETREMKDAEEERRAQTVAQLKQNSSDRETLLRQLEAANTEIGILSHRVTAMQESSLHAHQLEGEVLQLRKSLSDQQSQRVEHQLAREEGEREMRRLREENKAMRERLEQAAAQLTEMQKRSEEWRNERERLSKRMKELQLQVDGKQKEITGLKEGIQRTQHEREEKESTASLSLTQMKQELTKRAEQVMEMDSLLRSHQAETVSKRQELERKLAEKEEDLRIKAEEMEALSQQHAQSLKTIDNLRGKLLSVGDQADNKRELTQKTDLINHLQFQIQNKDGEIKSLNKKLEESKEEIARLSRTMASLRSQQETSNFNTKALASRDQQIARLKEQVQQLLEQERMKQEEVSRCRAQVVSLSTELAVERQMVQETRQQLAQERASQRHFQVATPLTPPVYHPPVSNSSHQTLPAKPGAKDNQPVSTTNHNIIHI